MIRDANWYGALLKNILHEGLPVGPRGKKTLEVVNVSARLPLARNILMSAERNPNYRFMAAEFLWMALGRRDVASLARYNKKMLAFSDDGETLAGAYGPWFKRGYPRALQLLQQDPDTRQAFIKIGQPDQGASKDVPCTVSWQFLVRRGRLDMVANMRSSDAWLGIPYDVYSFSQIANCVAGRLGVGRGDLYLNLASSHLYEEHLEAAERVVYGEDPGYGRSGALPDLPPYWLNNILDGETVAAEELSGEWFSGEWGRLAKALMSAGSRQALSILVAR